MPHYQLTSQNVSGEIIDDELIIVDLVSGAYFNSTGSALPLWRAITTGFDADMVIDRLSKRATNPDDFSNMAQSWVSSLVAYGVLVESCDAGPAEAEAATLFSDADLRDLAPPVLERHEDLEDLLLFDPIHDFDDLGWPNQPVRQPAR